MAIGLPFHGQSRSPADGAPEAAAAADGRCELAVGARTEGLLDLGLVRAVIDDGLLMVFGPEGDPIPPEIFRAAAAAQPDAAIQLRDGRRVAAERVAAVLDAQMRARHGFGRNGAHAWIAAMLGLGPQPEMAEDDEDGAVAVAAFGQELLLTFRSGAAFLVSEARARHPESICLRLAEEGPIDVGDLVRRLRAGAQPSRPAAADPAAPAAAHSPPELAAVASAPTAADPAAPTAADGGEFAAPDCRAWLEGDALAIDLPGVGQMQLARSIGGFGLRSLANVFTSGGATATLDDLAHALGQPPAKAPVAEHDRIVQDEQVAAREQEQIAERDRFAEDEQVAKGEQEQISKHDRLAEHDRSAEQERNAEPAQERVAQDEEENIAAAPAKEPIAKYGQEPIAGHDRLPERERVAGHEQITAHEPVRGNDQIAMPVAAAPTRSVPLHLTLPDAGAAAEDAVLVLVRGLPPGASLSAGAASGDGSWLLSPLDLPELALRLPVAGMPDCSLEVAAISIAGRDGELRRAASTLAVPLGSQAGAAAPAPIALGVDPQALGDIGPFDAIIVLDVPAGATLSAGTYDAAIDAWVVLPRQLAGLSVLAAKGHAQDFTVSLFGVGLRPDSPHGPRLLAQVPVSAR